MKTLHLISSDWWSPHFETDLELIEESIQSGHEPVIVFCKGDLPTCMINPEHRFLDCVRCVGRTHHGLNELTRLPRCIRLFSNFKASENTWDHFEIPRSLKEFVKIRDGNLDIGYAVATYLVDRTRNPEVDPTFDIRLTRQLLNLTSNSYQWFGELLEREKPAKVFAMNGRHLYYRSIFQASVDKNIPVFMHERGGEKNRYMLFENSLPHSLVFWDRLIERYKKKENKDTILKIGTAFYKDKIGGTELNWHSFTSDQAQDKLPEQFHSHQKKIGVFLSSEFEFAAVSPEWDVKPYSDQNAGVVKICKEINDPEMHFFIRAHPNMKNHNNQQLKNLEQNIPGNATYIAPESSVSSYALLRHCDVVLSFGSTMGVEACYWGKPSIIAGPAFYRSLNVGAKCFSHQQVLSALRGEWGAGDKDDALIYGAVMATFGVPFKHVRMETPFQGTFKNQNVQTVKALWRRIALKMAGAFHK